MKKIKILLLLITGIFSLTLLSSCQVWYSYPPRGLWYCEELNMTMWSEGKAWLDRKICFPEEMIHNVIWVREDGAHHLICRLLLGGGDALAIAEGKNGDEHQGKEYFRGPFDVKGGDTIIFWDGYEGVEYTFLLVSDDYEVDAEGNLKPYCQAE